MYAHKQGALVIVQHQAHNQPCCDESQVAPYSTSDSLLLMQRCQTISTASCLCILSASSINLVCDLCLYQYMPSLSDFSMKSF